MSDINKLVYESLGPALTQAAIWGTSAGMAHKFTQDKKPKMTKEEKKKQLRNLLINVGAGAAAGATGAALS